MRFLIKKQRRVRRKEARRIADKKNLAPFKLLASLSSFSNFPLFNFSVVGRRATDLPSKNQPEIIFRGKTAQRRNLFQPFFRRQKIHLRLIQPYRRRVLHNRAIHAVLETLTKGIYRHEKGLSKLFQSKFRRIVFIDIRHYFQNKRVRFFLMLYTA